MRNINKTQYHITPMQYQSFCQTLSLVSEMANAADTPNERHTLTALEASLTALLSNCHDGLTK